MKSKAMPLYPPLVEQAARLAARGHYHQFRKRETEIQPCGKSDEIPSPDCVPYITHPMGVMAILAQTGAKPELLAAALLHDYLEDVQDPVGEEHILSTCGNEVLELVQAVTEDKRRQSPAESTWEQRKTEGLRHLKKMSEDAVRLKTADLLHNILSLISDLELAHNPDDVWERFNAGLKRQLWYFHAVFETSMARLGEDNPLISSLKRSLQELETLTKRRKSV